MIGNEIRQQIFRDTKNFYLHFPVDAVAPQLIEFAKEHAGQAVLDLGCATGNYCTHLSRLGYAVKGADVNAEYVALACQRGVDACVFENTVPFPDDSFDTVLLFEVLEHLHHPEEAIAEAKRLARKNVLFTVPNSADVEMLRQTGLIYEHFADLDHRNYFTMESLRGLLQPHFARVQVTQGDPINPLGLSHSKLMRRIGSRFMRMGILKPRFFFRLYAVAET